MSKDKATFRKLRRIWILKQYDRRTKITLLNTLVKPLMLYRSEMWKTNVQDNTALQAHFFKKSPFGDL